MNENEIMTNNDEIIEVATEEIAKVNSGCFKNVAMVGIGMLAGIVIYKYIAKPAYDNFKEKRATKASIKASPEVYQEELYDEDDVIDTSEND
jgi:hypothetical protein